MSKNSRFIYTSSSTNTLGESYILNIGQGVAPELNSGGIYYDIIPVGKTDHRVDDLVNEVNEYLTGIILEVPAGFHLELACTSELWRRGYMLPGNVVIPNDGQELVIPLFKFSDKLGDIELGQSCGVHLVLRETYHTNFLSKQGLNNNNTNNMRGPQQGYQMNQMMYGNQQQTMIMPIQQQQQNIRQPLRRNGNGLI